MTSEQHTQHTHGAGELCGPCMDALDEAAEELYEQHYQLALRWWRTMPAGESLDHLMRVTKDRLQKEHNITA